MVVVCKEFPIFPKCPNPEHPRKFRGIALVPVLQKLYVLCLGLWFDAAEAQLATVDAHARNP